MNSNCLAVPELSVSENLVIDKKSISILGDLIIEEADWEDRRWLHKVVDLFLLNLGCLQSKTLSHRQSADDFRIFFHIADFIITMRILPGEDIVGCFTKEEHRSIRFLVVQPDHCGDLCIKCPVLKELGDNTIIQCLSYVILDSSCVVEFDDLASWNLTRYDVDVREYNRHFISVDLVIKHVNHV